MKAKKSDLRWIMKYKKTNITENIAKLESSAIASENACCLMKVETSSTLNPFMSSAG